MYGTYMNVATVTIGTIIGVTVGKRLKPHYKELTMHALGLATLAMGAQMFMAAPNAIIGIVSIVSVIVGGLIGELIGIEKGLNAIGEYAQKRLPNGDGSHFQQAFVTTSIVFCVGPMTIIGCLQDGLGQGFQLLALKSILDLFSSTFFAAAFGWGVLLSAGTVLVAQGSLTIAAGTLSGMAKTDPTMLAMTAAGGIILLGIGFRLLEMKNIRVSNLIPGLALAPLIIWFLINQGWYNYLVSIVNE